VDSAKSDTYIQFIMADLRDVNPDATPTNWTYLHDYHGHPIQGVDASVARLAITTWTSPNDISYSHEAGDGYPIPTIPVMENGSAKDMLGNSMPSDHHLHIVDRDANRLYELYQAYPQVDGTWAADSGALWHLSSNAPRPKGHGSTDAAGLPIVPGNIRHDEVMSPQGIQHALRINVWYTDDSYVFPARSKAEKFHDQTRPPMGQRFRLKSSYDISGFGPQTRAILAALKKYGAKSKPQPSTGTPNHWLIINAGARSINARPKRKGCRTGSRYTPEP